MNLHKEKFTFDKPNIYILSKARNNEKAIQDALGKRSAPITKVSYSSQRQFPVSSHVNYIEPIPSSMRTNIVKSIAVGKSAYKVGLPLIAPIGTKIAS